MLWSSIATFENFSIEILSGDGIFYIQYNSQILIKSFKIANYSCSNAEKGCIFSVVSNSSLIANMISIENITAIASLMHVDSSTLNLSNISLGDILINAQSDPFVITCDLGHLNVFTLLLQNFYGGVLESDQSFINFSDFSITMNNYTQSQGLFESPLFSISKSTNFTVKNSVFGNIQSGSSGGVNPLIFMKFA